MTLGRSSAEHILSTKPDFPLLALQRIAFSLDQLGVPYAIIGGVAVSIQSVPRYTEDIDAVIWFGEDGWQNLLESLKQHGFVPRAADPIQFAQRNRLLLLTDSNSVQIDIAFGALPFEEELVKTAKAVELSDGFRLKVASPEALVLMKAIAWRPKDQLDIRDLVSVNPHLDWQQVIEQFGEYANLLEVPERVEDLKNIVVASAQNL